MLQKSINITLIVFVLFMVGIVSVGIFGKNQPQPKTETQPIETTTSSEPVPTPTPNKTTTLTATEIAKHNSTSYCWLLISSKVYDVTIFLKTHPGGSSVIINYCGQDATAAFTTKDGQGSHSTSAQNMLGDYLLGNLNEVIVR